jgi:NADH-quinone oxidoreductase subunit J
VTLLIVLLAVMVAFLVLAIFLTDLLRSAIALALASATLSIIFFVFRVPYAAVFELSVCAGLVMVLLASTIGLTKREQPENEEKGKSVVLVLPVLALVLLALIDILVFLFMSSRVPLVHNTQNTVSGMDFAQTLWRYRWLDILGQLAIILAGVFAILALFRKEGGLLGGKPESEEKHGS